MKIPKYYGKYLLSDAIKMGLVESTLSTGSVNTLNRILVKSLNNNIDANPICETCLDVCEYTDQVLCKFTNKPGGCIISTEMMVTDFSDIVLIKRDWSLPS